MYILLYYVLLSTVATLVKISQILYAMVLRLCVRVLQVDIVRNVIFFFIQIFHLFKICTYCYVPQIQTYMYVHMTYIHT